MIRVDGARDEAVNVHPFAVAILPPLTGQWSLRWFTHGLIPGIFLINQPYHRKGRAKSKPNSSDWSMHRTISPAMQHHAKKIKSAGDRTIKTITA
jgi:hypothetical protein